MSFYIGDVPKEPLRVVPPSRIALDVFDSATATLRTPDGTSTPVAAEVDIDDVKVTLPTAAGSPFSEAGVCRVRVRLHSPEAGDLTIPDVRFVVQDPDSEWHTLDTIRDDDAWPDAEHIGDVTLWNLLDVVRGQVLEFAPTLDVDDPVPEHYRLGQAIHARNTWNATRTAPDGGMGEGDFVIRPYPLDWHVRQILRPRSGRPVVL